MKGQLYQKLQFWLRNGQILPCGKKKKPEKKNEKKSQKNGIGGNFRTRQKWFPYAGFFKGFFSCSPITTYFYMPAEECS